MTDVLPREIRHSLVPMVLEESKGGERAFDIYSMLLRQRIIFLGQEVDDQIANLIISQMLYLEAQDADRDINLYINSPGGLAYGGMAIYDVIQHVRPDVSTICVGYGDVGGRNGALRWCTRKAHGATERAHHDPPGQRGCPRCAQ